VVLRVATKIQLLALASAHSGNVPDRAEDISKGLNGEQTKNKSTIAELNAKGFTLT
jgi:hypothetical protein